jgi:hypothetical protein
MIEFVPHGDDFLCAANDNGEHRPPSFHDVKEARQRLAQVGEQRLATLTHAWRGGA